MFVTKCSSTEYTSAYKTAYTLTWKQIVPYLYEELSSEDEHSG
jgi:hypothetical protein